MLWVVAILTMVVGAVARDHPDRREADARLLLDRARRLPAHRRARRRRRVELADGQITSLQAVLFYLVAYGFATIGAFAVVTLVRDAGGEATHLSPLGRPGQGARRWWPGVFALFLLALAGIPLTAGFIGKWAVFAVGARRPAPGRSWSSRCCAASSRRSSTCG